METHFRGAGPLQSLRAPFRMIGVFRVLLILLLLTGCLWRPSVLSAFPAATEEDVLQAAFLYNFMKFVEWPPEAFDRPESPILVCTLGENPFTNTVQALEGKRIRQSPLVVRRYDPVKPTVQCHVLVVSNPASKDSYPTILSKFRAVPVLTVGNIEGFVEKGGMIEMFSLENKIRFNINSGSANRSALKISSQLLKLARKIIE